MVEQHSTRSFGQSAKTVFLAAAVVLCLLVVVATLVYATDVFLILFLAILFGVFLTHASAFLQKTLRIPYFAGLTVIATAIVLAVAGIVVFSGVMINSQIEEGRRQLASAREEIRRWTARYPLVESLLDSTPFLSRLTESGRSSNENASEGDAPESKSEKPTSTAMPRREAAAVAGVFKTTFGFLVNLLLIFFVGLDVAADPEGYRRGVVSLFPPDRRQRANEIMRKFGTTLWHWLMGQFLTMLITGVSASVVLLVLNVPMAMSLGVMTGLLAFIPNIGALISVVAVAIFAVPQGLSTVIAVVVSLVVLQLVESYVVTPLIQKQQVSLPPALLLAFQAIMGVLFGFLGALVASPVLAVMKVGVEEIYIGDVLNAETL